jgi:hypothetical protein
VAGAAGAVGLAALHLLPSGSSLASAQSAPWSDQQRVLLHNLLRASSSSQGYHKMALAIHADQVLSQIENGDPLFGSANFYITIWMRACMCCLRTRRGPSSCSRRSRATSSRSRSWERRLRMTWSPGHPARMR